MYKKKQCLLFLISLYAYSLQAIPFLERDALASAAIYKQKLKGGSNYYESSNDGTAVDKKKGLMWMRCSLGQVWREGDCHGKAKVFKWTEAKKEANLSVFAGYKNWRLPKKNELRSLVYCDTGTRRMDDHICKKGRTSPTVNHGVFPNTQTTFYWSSSEAINSNTAWAIYFNYGNEIAYSFIHSLHVRLVRIEE